MSIEALIQAHTAALLENTEAVKLLTLSLAGRTPSKTENKVEDSSKAGKTKTEKVEEKKADPKVEEADTASGADESAGTAVEPTSYETLRALVLKLAPTNRDGIKAVSAKHGIAAPKDLLKDSSDYTSVTDQDKLEAVYADLLALEA